MVNRAGKIDGHQPVRSEWNGTGVNPLQHVRIKHVTPSDKFVRGLTRLEITAIFQGISG